VVAGEQKDYSKIGKVLAAIFAVAAIGGSFGGGNMFQINQAFQQVAGLDFMKGSFLATNGWAFGLVMAVLVAVVIIGGIKSIAKVTDKIVPFMCGMYVLAGLVVIGFHASALPEAFSAIFKGAFAPTAIAGGMVGVLIQGFRRAAFSNEAGIGSASIAHSAVKTQNPASEGLVSLLEPFIDTVIVCTMTALVIVITGAYKGSGDGIALTSRAFETVMPWFKYILAGAVLLFAFSTMITWSYYGQQAWTYLFGRGKVKEYVYKLLFCAMVVVGAAASLDAVIGFSDAMIFTMLFPNVIGLIFLAPVVKAELQKYLAKIQSGEIKRYK
jgi:AGCS family alanine or glycine:cation symporter